MKLWARAKTLFARDKDPDPSASLAESTFREAIAHHQQGRMAQAERLYAKVLELQPDHVAALNFLGVLAYQNERPARSVELITKAIAIDPSQPGFHSNLALSLNAVGRGREAIESCDRAIALDPECVEAHSNKGNSLWGLGRREEALASYARALAIQPDHVQTHWNEGFLRLQIGQFELGWRKHEWRWHLPHVAVYKRDFAQPLWLGKEDLRGKTDPAPRRAGPRGHVAVLPLREDGERVGRNRGARSATAAEGAAREPGRRLARGGSRRNAAGIRPSLPLVEPAAGIRDDVRNIPAEPAYVRCDPAAAARWRGRLGPKSGLRVGLVWMGSNGDRRSVPLREVLKLVTANVQFVCLQKEVSAEDRSLLAGRRDITVVADELADFSDTAAVVELMDLVVTDRHQRRAPGRRHGKTGVDPARGQSGLALVPRSGRQPLVSHCAPLQAARGGRLGQRDLERAQRTGKIPLTLQHVRADCMVFRVFR